MADYRTRPNTGVQGRTAVQMDEGLRSYMLRVYNFMGLGVALTAVLTMYLAANPALMATVALGPMKWVLFAGVLGLGWFAPRLIMGGSTIVAHAAYWGYAALWGLLISPMVAYCLLYGHQRWPTGYSGAGNYISDIWCLKPVWLCHQT